jgi:hypothetical protein
MAHDVRASGLLLKGRNARPSGPLIAANWAAEGASSVVIIRSARTDPAANLQAEAHQPAGTALAVLPGLWLYLACSMDQLPGKIFHCQVSWSAILNSSRHRWMHVCPRRSPLRTGLAHIGVLFRLRNVRERLDRSSAIAGYHSRSRKT